MTPSNEDLTLPSRRGWAYGAGLALLVALWFTLGPAETPPGALAATRWWCVLCGPSGGADFFQNLLLLLPLGFCLARARWQPARAILLVILIPIGIELAQGFIIPGRDASLGDVLANAAGGMLGFWLGSGRSRRADDGTGVGHRMTALAHGLFIAQLIATASLVRPRIAGPEPWQISMTPTVPGRPTYRGSVLDAARDGRAIVNPFDARSNSGNATPIEWRWLLTWDQFDNNSVTPIYRIDDSRGWEIVSLDRRGSLVGVSSRIGASLLRLRLLTFAVPVPAGTSAGDSLSMVYQARHGTVALTASLPGHAEVTHHYRLGAQHGWALINPFTPVHASESAWRYWTLAWLLGWGVLLGLTLRSWRSGWPWLAAALASLWAATLWSATPATIPEVIALALGIIVAQQIGLRRRYRSG